MRKTVLFYVFTPLADPEAIRLWQHAIADAHGLTGRVVVSEHGINATLAGEMGAVKRYVRATRGYAPFARADVKWSTTYGGEFPGLSVKARPEIVTFGVPHELKVDENGVIGGGVHLTPSQVHELVQTRDDVVFFDGRNAYEAEIGRFRGAVVPDVRTTRDFVGELDSGRYDHLKDKPVVTYCTGGVRCEVLSALMTARGFGEVYQIDGGIVRYGEKYGSDGLWDGALYVFDGRMSVDVGAGTVPLGVCTRCGDPTGRYVNDEDDDRTLILVCEACG
ncbi:rhodanese-related sulfurtransferase [Rhodococcus rhodnii]|uniref:tRNA uridine(34) hydroxylase n=2 Tax=Rhodococcus rhodnii TaxID=38312 RepID=R7WSZ4_9NOCA|nr:rhodanese-related sulfurtransferase [Rhodococcus rhodnii]EOM78390.1 hypothetical protein Rrhod_0218 [Rhodococcus rhodnii LMG 5362]TXG91214.1 rhodanese-related sulfurtransferase [Rhodococcus rhodnii]